MIFGGLWMALEAAQFQRQVTAVASAGKAAQLVVPADARRWFLRVYSLAGGTTVSILVPNASALLGLTPVAVPAPVESKFKDAPGMTTGEWYGNGLDPNGWLVIEDLYVGR